MTRNIRTKKPHPNDPRFIDLTGQTFGHLTAIEYVGSDKWRWKCDCGQETIARASSVKSGKIQSCGHVLSDTAKAKIESNILRHHDGSSVPHIEHIIEGKVRSNNTTGLTGVSVRAYKGYTMYRASITVRGKYIYLGEYKTPEDAAKVRHAAEEKYFYPIIDSYYGQKK